jgi:hypothetical protein
MMFVMGYIISPAVGATYNWTNNDFDNDFANYNNWDPVPTGPFLTSADTLIIEMGGYDKAILNSTTVTRYLQICNTASTIGEIEIASGGNLSMAKSVKVGSGAGSSGIINVNGGSLNSTGDYATLGIAGEGHLNISAGSYHANRITLAQNAGSLGEIVLTGTGYLDIDTYIQGGSGDLKVKMIGSDTKFEIGTHLVTKDTATSTIFEFVLDGANGVGAGIVAGDITLVNGTVIDLSFMDETVNGTYTIMSCQGLFTDLSTDGLLSAASKAVGWTYEIVNVDGVNELQVSIPEPATLCMLLLGASAIWRKKK